MPLRRWQRVADQLGELQRQGAKRGAAAQAVAAATRRQGDDEANGGVGGANQALRFGDLPAMQHVVESLQPQTQAATSDSARPLYDLPAWLASQARGRYTPLRPRSPWYDWTAWAANALPVDQTNALVALDAQWARPRSRAAMLRAAQHELAALWDWQHRRELAGLPLNPSAAEAAAADADAAQAQRARAERLQGVARAAEARASAILSKATSLQAPDGSALWWRPLLAETAAARARGEAAAARIRAAGGVVPRPAWDALTAHYKVAAAAARQAARGGASQPPLLRSRLEACVEGAQRALAALQSATPATPHTSLLVPSGDTDPAPNAPGGDAPSLASAQPPRRTGLMAALAAADKSASAVPGASPLTAAQEAQLQALGLASDEAALLRSLPRPTAADGGPLTGHALVQAWVSELRSAAAGMLRRVRAPGTGGAGGSPRVVELLQAGRGVGGGLGSRPRQHGAQTAMPGGAMATQQHSRPAITWDIRVRPLTPMLDLVTDYLSVKHQDVLLRRDAVSRVLVSVGAAAAAGPARRPLSPPEVAHLNATATALFDAGDAEGYTALVLRLARAGHVTQAEAADLVLAAQRRAAEVAGAASQRGADPTADIAAADLLALLTTGGRPAASAGEGDAALRAQWEAFTGGAPTFAEVVELDAQLRAAPDEPSLQAAAARLNARLDQLQAAKSSSSGGGGGVAGVLRRHWEQVKDAAGLPPGAVSWNAAASPWEQLWSLVKAVYEKALSQGGAGLPEAVSDPPAQALPTAAMSTLTAQPPYPGARPILRFTQCVVLGPASGLSSRSMRWLPTRVRGRMAGHPRAAARAGYGTPPPALRPDHPATRRVQLRVRVAELAAEAGLQPDSVQHLLRVAGPRRVDEAAGELILVGDRYATREENRRWCLERLHLLIDEAARFQSDPAPLLNRPGVTSLL